MKKKNNVLFGLFVILTSMALVIALTPKEIQNDLFYDIKLGNLIFKNGIDLKDHFSFFSLNYTYPHWLFDVIVAFLYNHFSFHGIYLFVMIVFFVILLCIYKVSNRMNQNNRLISFLLLFLVSNLLKPGITARSQLLSYFLFIIQIFILESFLITKKGKYLIFLPILSLLLANIHGTIWPFQFILYLPYIVEHLCFLFKNKKKNKSKISADKLYIEDVSHFKKVYPYLFLSLFVGVFTPCFGIAYTYFIKIMQTNTISILLEHKPTVLTQNLLYLFFILFLLLLFILTKTKIRMRDFLMIGGLLFTSLFSIRHVLLFACIGLLFVGRYLSDVVQEESKVTCEVIYSYLTKPIFCILFLLFLFVVSFQNYKIHRNEEYFTKEDYPIDAVKYMKKHLDYKKIRLFNNYNEGSYILFCDIKVFIDSRSDLYTKPFNKKMDIFDDYIEAYMNLSYEKIFKKYNFSHVLIRKDDSLYKILSKDKNYMLLYDDDFFVLMEKV